MSQTKPCDRRQWVLSILDEHEVRLVRFAARMLGDEDAARDVVQYAFLRLCDRAADEIEDRAVQWLFTVCRNRAVDLLRSRRRTARLEEATARNDVSREPDPAVTAERHDLYQRLNRLIAALPPAAHEAVDLWAEGFSYREIAEITGHGEGKLRVLVHRALKRLRADPATRRLLGDSEENLQSRSTQPTGKVRI